VGDHLSISKAGCASIILLKKQKKNETQLTEEF
jgi:hypothetical protein